MTLDVESKYETNNKKVHWTTAAMELTAARTFQCVHVDPKMPWRLWMRALIPTIMKEKQGSERWERKWESRPSAHPFLWKTPGLQFSTGKDFVRAEEWRFQKRKNWNAAVIDYGQLDGRTGQNIHNESRRLVLTLGKHGARRQRWSSLLKIRRVRPCHQRPYADILW